MIELLGVLVIHAAFVTARESNLRIDHKWQPLAWGVKVCGHGRAVTQSCWHCPREIAGLRWAGWMVFSRLQKFVGQTMTPELRASIIDEIHDTIKGVAS